MCVCDWFGFQILSFTVSEVQTEGKEETQFSACTSRYEPSFLQLRKSHSCMLWITSCESHPLCGVMYQPSEHINKRRLISLLKYRKTEQYYQCCFYFQCIKHQCYVLWGKVSHFMMFEWFQLKSGNSPNPVDTPVSNMSLLKDLIHSILKICSM